MRANFSLLRDRNFLCFIGARTSMVLAFQIMVTIAHWQIYASTHSSLFIGYLALTEVIPAIGLSLIGGYWADSFNRRRMVLIGSLFTIASAAILLLKAAEHRLVAITPLFYASAIVGVGRGILGPASTALLGEIVQKQYYARAAVFNSIGWHTALICGPALAGIFYEKYTPLLCYEIASGLAVAAFLFYACIVAPGKPNSRREKLSHAVREGLRFVFREKLILGAMSLDMFAVLFGGAIALLPAFSDEVYRMGASGLGYLRAAPAIGAAAMGVLLALIPIREHAGKILLASVAAFGFLIIVFGINRNFHAALIILALTGAADNISVVMRSTILQVFTPDAMRGRVAAINSIFIASSNEIGAFESGLTASIMGLVPSVVFGGSMTMLVVAAVAIAIPPLRRLNFSDSQK